MPSDVVIIINTTRDEHNNNMQFIKELKRRQVFQVGVSYLAIAWVALEISDLLFDALEVPGWAIKVVIVLLAAGFPISLLGAWIFRVSFSSGIELESGPQAEQTEPA